jgi:hypothetical protein
MLDDGSPLSPGSVVGRLHGPSVGVLAGERTLLNLLGVLCGTATTTRRSRAISYLLPSSITRPKMRGLWLRNSSAQLCR